MKCLVQKASYVRLLVGFVDGFELFTVPPRSDWAIPTAKVPPHLLSASAADEDENR